MSRGHVTKLICMFRSTFGFSSHAQMSCILTPVLFSSFSSFSSFFHFFIFIYVFLFFPISSHELNHDHRTNLIRKSSLTTLQGTIISDLCPHPMPNNLLSPFPTPNDRSPCRLSVCLSVCRSSALFLDHFHKSSSYFFFHFLFSFSLSGSSIDGSALLSRQH